MGDNMSFVTNGLSDISLRRLETQADTCKGYSGTWFIVLLLVVLMTGCNGNSASLGGGSLVSSTVPADGATGVAVDAPITATFSVAMATATITTTTFTVTGPGLTPVTGTVALSADGLTATFIPATSLTFNTLFTATITTGAKAQDGTAMADNKVWSFTTAPDTTAPTVTLTAPADAATGVATNTKITATFSEAMDSATITTTTFTVTGPGLTPVTGPVALSADGLSATFTPASNLAFNTLFTATITSGATDLAGNAMSASKVWTFTTGAAPDITPPTVSSTDPVNLAKDVEIGAPITATFSEQINPATITTTTFKVAVLIGSTPVTGTVALSADGLTATFTPDSNLPANTQFIATLTTGVEDLSGNAMTLKKQWLFTTGTPPTVTVTDPANGATSVAVNSTITATFSEAMDTATINTTTFTVVVLTDSAPVIGTVALSADGLTATFKPASNLAANTAFSARVTTGVKDLSGNAMIADKEWVFTTGP